MEYTADKIKKMIQHQKRKYDWHFIFLGANIDAVSTAAKFGIEEDFAVDYHADGMERNLNYEAVSEAVRNLRSGKNIDRTWKEGIERDYHQRLKNG